MATPLDVGLLQNFQVIFPFLFVLVIMFGLFRYLHFLGDNVGVQAFLALVIALILLISPMVREIINRMAPWFVLLFIFIIFVLIAFKIFGTSDSQIMDAMKSHPSMIWWTIALALIIGLGSTTYVVSEHGVFDSGRGEVTETTGDSGAVQGVGEDSFWATLFHPKVLGLLLIFLIGLFTIQRLATVAR